MNWYLITFGVAILIFILMKKSDFNFNYTAFADALGMSESSNSYSNASNGIAFGRYQFIPSTIDQISNELGVDTTVTDFLNNPQQQDDFYKQYVNDIISYVKQNNLDKFIGNKITGRKNKIITPINIYGLVAGAWLGGNEGLNNFLINGVDPNDGNTYVSDYIAKFSQLFNI